MCTANITLDTATYPNIATIVQSALDYKESFKTELVAKNTEQRGQTETELRSLGNNRIPGSLGEPSDKEGLGYVR